LRNLLAFHPATLARWAEHFAHVGHGHFTHTLFRAAAVFVDWRWRRRRRHLTGIALATERANRRGAVVEAGAGEVVHRLSCSEGAAATIFAFIKRNLCGGMDGDDELRGQRPT